jgi:hypothetical protein
MDHLPEKVVGQGEVNGSFRGGGFQHLAWDPRTQELNPVGLCLPISSSVIEAKVPHCPPCLYSLLIILLVPRPMENSPRFSADTPVLLEFT